jgi:3-dehydro-L-gulonate 2-dehydrogenase
MLRVPFQELFDVLLGVLLKIGFGPERARLCARLFADATCDGVYSHGLNRFPQYVRMIHNGCIDIHARAERVAGSGSLERWDGRRGPGNLNAYQCMDRAIALAREHGTGCVALGNTNHWMRGGSYGWQAVEAGVIGLCWTNTLPNLPAWGADRPRLGNNPLVIAVPRPGGHVVLDMAMSQFSYGALGTYHKSGRPLPVEGGFDADGQLTRDPGAILASKRGLPIGYWKGSGLSLVLDMMAAMLSGGQAVYQIPADTERESGVSQVFLAINLPALDHAGFAAQIADQIVEYLQSVPNSTGGPVRYPGERTRQTRQENLEKGIPLEPSIWREVQAMLTG